MGTEAILLILPIALLHLALSVSRVIPNRKRWLTVLSVVAVAVGSAVVVMVSNGSLQSLLLAVAGFYLFIVFPMSLAIAVCKSVAKLVRRRAQQSIQADAASPRRLT